MTSPKKSSESLQEFYNHHVSCFGADFTVYAIGQVILCKIE